MNRDRNHRQTRAQRAALVLLAALIAGCGSAGGGHGDGAAVSPPVTGQPSSPPSAAAGGRVWLDTVQMLSATNGWALVRTSGNGQLQPARTADGGRTWQAVTPAAARSRLANGPVLLDGTSADRAWLAVAGPNGTTTSVFSTGDGGQTWQQSAPVPGSQPVVIDFPGPANGWLLESLGAVMGQNPVQLFRSTDGGQHWTSEARSPMGTRAEVGGLPAGCDKSGMSFSSDGASGWITSFCNSLGGAVLESGDGGAHWAMASLPVPPHACLSGGCEVPAPQFAGDTTFLQINDYPAAAYLLVSADSGANWRVERMPAGAGPYPRSQFFSPSDGIAVAAGPQQSVGDHTYVTGDGGRTWAVVPLSRPFGNAGASFDFVSPATGFAWVPGASSAGSAAAMYKTTNSGRTWTSFAPRLG